MKYAPLSPNPADAIAWALAGEHRGVSVKSSGSTGAPRDVLLSAEAMRAAANATHQVLRGPGQWLLATPPHHVAGAMVLARSAVAHTVAATMPQGPFTAEGFARGAESLGAEHPRYTSLVPTQLHRLLESPIGRDALTAFDAVLVGGAPLHAATAPANVVVTYGATETAGGCVYDGVPLPGVRVDVVGGAIRVAGPNLADGYADGDTSRFVVENDTTWFVTSDLGEWDASGRLRVVGRADDAILTGGETVHPTLVEAELAARSWVADVVVVGIPDPEWGERVVALVVPQPGTKAPPWERTRTELVAALGRAAAPRAMMMVDALPRLSSDKTDRAAAREMARLQSHTLGGT